MHFRRDMRLRRLDIAWRIPIGYFDHLFTKHFWEFDLELDGPEGLYPEKQVGHGFKHEPTATGTSREPGSVLPGEERVHVREGYQLEIGGDIVSKTYLRSK